MLTTGGRLLKSISFMLLVSVGFSGQASAGLDEAIAAIKNGNYAEAMDQLIDPVQSALSKGTRVLEEGTCTVIVATMPPVERGIAVFEALLGDVYYLGHGVPKDYEAAVKWYQRAANKGNALSQSTLGDIYYYGYGVPQNYVEAAKWWQLAANQGAHVAQLNLSVMYANGNGVPKNLVKSHMYANLAAGELPPGNDRDTATRNRDYVATLMKPTQIAEAQRLAAEWQPTSSKTVADTVESVNSAEKNKSGKDGTRAKSTEKIICKW